MKANELKRKTQAFYYDLRGRGLNHQAAMSACLDLIIEKLEVVEKVEVKKRGKAR